VNNAGISIDDSKNALDVSRRTIEKTLQTNVVGPLLLCQNCIALMKAGGYGRIVNMSSTLGSLSEIADPNSAYAGVGTPAYRLSKAALNAITTLIAKEVCDDNILVNSACPGWVRTDMGGDQAPLTPEQGADTPVWLATLPDGGPTGSFYRERTRIPW
jgi:NAD(P)-dependent dehydrogenase (short-subunit alcohol dehydrogenase family)